MYKVIIVDDEEIVRVALKSLIDWENNGFLQPYEASNGEMALDVIKTQADIDVVITDINMPIMDGLKLIESLRKLPSVPEIIVLSAYEDYNLVRNAFKLGIADYIIKSEMEPDSVLTTIMTALSRSGSRKKAEKKFSSYRKQIYLKNILLGEPNNVNEREEEADIPILKEKQLIICNILLDNFHSIVERYERGNLDELSKNIIESISVALNGDYSFEVVSVSPEITAVIVAIDQHSRSKMYELIEGLLVKIRKRLSDYMNIKITVGVSHLAYGIESLPGLYEESLTCVGYRYLLGKGRNIYPEHIQRIEQVDHCSIYDLKEPLSAAILKLDKAATMQALEDILSVIGSFRCSRIDQISGYYMELVYYIVHFMHEQNQDTEDIYEHNTDLLSMMSHFETKVEIEKWIMNFVGNLMDYYMASKKESQVILRAKEYVRDHYMHKISLADVCEVLELSEGYFSALFTQECGVSFIHFLTDFRIQQAKKLLSTTGMKIYEICEAVGYENAEHFSRVFKKVTGVSPLQYKSK